MWGSLTWFEPLTKWLPKAIEISMLEFKEYIKAQSMKIIQLLKHFEH